jgi:hypothetical protein
MTRMPWGKYQGRVLGSLPFAYLKWLAGRDLRPSLRFAVDREYDRRVGLQTRRHQWAGAGAHPRIEDLGRPGVMTTRESRHPEQSLREDARGR